jgi:hypothetical protein
MHHRLFICLIPCISFMCPLQTAVVIKLMRKDMELNEFVGIVDFWFSVIVY